MTQTRSGSIRLGLAFVVVLLGACTTHPSIWSASPSLRRPSAPAKALPESFENGRETVAVVLYKDPGFDPEYIRIPAPEPKGARGAGNAVSGLWGSCLPPAAGLISASALYVPWIMGTALLAGCTAATPFVALDGAVLGWAKPLSRDEIRFVNGSIKYTLGQAIDDDALVESVLRTARDQTPHTLRSWKSASSPTRDRRSEYDAMARDGIDTVLELELVPVFALGEGPDYPLALRVEANARLTSVRNGGVLYNETLVFCCESHAKSQWAADGGALLRAFFTNAYPLLGERIAEKVFVTHRMGGGAEQPLALGLK